MTKIVLERNLSGLRFYDYLVGKKSTNLRGIDIVAMRKGKQLTLEQKNNIISPIAEVDIIKALKDISDNTSPGQDGYGAKFFKTTWEITKYDVCVVVHEFFDKERMVCDFNSALVTLIPKSKNAKKIKLQNNVQNYSKNPNI